MTIPHLAFFRRLANLPDESSSEWYLAFAGLAVLKLVDDWVSAGPTLFSTNRGGLAAAMAAVDRVMDRPTLYQAMRQTVEAVAHAGAVDVARIAQPLLEFGTLLRHEGELTLAEDVYCSVYQHATQMNHPASPDRELSVVSCRTALQLGSVLREQRALDKAEEAYASALAAAAMLHDVQNVILAKLGHANVVVDRGNIPEARTLLDALVVDAEALGNAELHAKTLHESGHLAVLQHQYVQAAVLVYSALRKARECPARERMLADLSVILVQLGHFTAARDANHILSVVATEHSVRQQALINLMEIASLDGEPMLFEHYRSAIDPTTLPLRLQGHFFLEAGLGFRRLARPISARQSFDTAHAIAKRHGLHQLLFTVEAEWDRLRNDFDVTPSAVAHADPWPVEILSIASQLDVWRSAEPGDLRSRWTQVSEGVGR